jgi:hypothetical protein
MIEELTTPSPRLFTTHGTVLYVNCDSGELRHGHADRSPPNARIALAGKHGQLIMPEVPGSGFPIRCRQGDNPLNLCPATP